MSTINVTKQDKLFLELKGPRMFHKYSESISKHKTCLHISLIDAHLILPLISFDLIENKHDFGFYVTKQDMYILYENMNNS